MVEFSRLLLLLSFAGINFACNCDFPHPQTRFCDAPFVIRATVNTVTELPKPKLDADMLPAGYIISPWPVNYKYELTINTIIKNSTTVDLTAKPFIMYSSFGPDFCGVPPGSYVGTEMLVHGKKLRPEDAGSLQPQMATCGDTVLWEELSDRDQNLVTNVYGPACQECTIVKTCKAEEGCQPTDTCNWDVTNDFMDFCFWDKVCKRMNGGNCDWADRARCDFDDLPDWMKNRLPVPKNP